MRDVEKITIGNGEARCVFRARAHEPHAGRGGLGLCRAPGDGGDAPGGLRAGCLLLRAPPLLSA